MNKAHSYELSLKWTGNLGTGTSTYSGYSRDHVIAGKEKQISIPGASDPAFRGDPSRYNPEEMLLASLASCHMLWYLHLCARDKIIVTKYLDNPVGTMEEAPDGGGRFTQVVLRPLVTIESGDLARAKTLHSEANKLCFIANSCNFPILHEPEIVTG